MSKQPKYNLFEGGFDPFSPKIGPSILQTFKLTPMYALQERQLAGSLRESNTHTIQEDAVP